MTALAWGEVEGQEFTGAEARSASDFGEVLFNHALDADEGWAMFKDRPLTTGQRLFLAAKAESMDTMAGLLLAEPDARVRAVLTKRMEAERGRESGGIVYRA